MKTLRQIITQLILGLNASEYRDYIRKKRESRYANKQVKLMCRRYNGLKQIGK